MQLDRGLAIAGLVLSLPGFVLLFSEGHQAATVLSLLLGGVILVAAGVVWYLNRLPPYSVRDATVTLEFLNGGCALARLSKHYRVRPNFAHLDSMTHKNIAADGQVENLCWNGQLISAGNTRFSLGEYEVVIGFPGPHKRWEDFEGSLSYDLRDSFPANPEGLVYVIDYPTTVVRFSILFPETRPAKSAVAFRVEGGVQKPIQVPSISPDGRKLEMTLKRPRLGNEYRIFWEW